MLFKIKLLSSFTMETGWFFLDAEGAVVHYAMEEKNEIFFIASSLPSNLSGHCGIVSCTPFQEEAINWEEQWKLSGLKLTNGAVSIPVGSSLLKLYAGPGFGDSSHPTTSLVMEMMAPYVKDTKVIDIGCGSGILSLAAKLLGASYVLGIDIEREAILHARKNGEQNDLKVDFSLPDKESQQGIECEILLINMIFSEQKVALSDGVSKYPNLKRCFTSGILKEEREKYLLYCHQLGWQVIEEKEKEGWLGFHFCNFK